jgi:hypothetical protein
MLTLSVEIQLGRLNLPRHKTVRHSTFNWKWRAAGY